MYRRKVRRRSKKKIKDEMLERFTILINQVELVGFWAQTRYFNIRINLFAYNQKLPSENYENYKSKT